MQFKLLSVALAVFVVCAAAAQTNTTSSNSTITVPVSIYAPSLLAETATCPVRDQILRLNQLAAVEYLNRAYFIDLMNKFNSLPKTAASSSLGLPAGFNVTDVQSNLTLIVNQLNIVATYFNSTIPGWCSQLTTDDQIDCFVYSPCSNYTFGNLTAWSTSSASSNSSSGNSTHSGNSSQPSNSTSGSNLPSGSTVLTAVRQGVYFCNDMVNFIIGTVPLLSNSTLQLQLMEFEALHAQQASYLQLLSGSSPLVQPTVITAANSNQFNRGSIMSQLVGYVANPTCCDGWRNVHRS